MTRILRRPRPTVLACACACGLTAIVTLVPARGAAQEVGRGALTVGLYAPSAPFDGPEARFAFATELARHLGQKLGRPVAGRVFARAADFQAAVRSGEVKLAFVDAAYLAAAGGTWEPLVVATRGGKARTSWEVISRKPVASLADLRGATVALPAVGSRDEAFLYRVLFLGEIGPSWLAKVVPAPDALSAVAAVGVGRVDAAVVPAGLPLPGDVQRGLVVREVPWAVLVALPGLDRTTAAAARAAMADFRAGVFDGFTNPASADVAELRGALAGPARRGPLAVPAVRADAKALLVGRRFRIELVDLTPFADPPKNRP